MVAPLRGALKWEALQWPIKNNMTKDELSKYIDHTCLKPDATRGMIDSVCQEAAEYGFKSVCVNPIWIRHVAEKLEGAPVLPCCVVGFPLGAGLTSIKALEAAECCALGAKEIDMVINIGAAKAQDWEGVMSDVAAVVTAVSGRAVVKAIIEVRLLTDAEKIRACICAKEAGAGFVKTSTGFLGGGATVSDVRLMRSAVGDAIGVKASGGIRSYNDAIAMIQAGANRIGCSASIAIINGIDRRHNAET
jgi:deoxyribose-phosphate aldolase